MRVLRAFRKRGLLPEEAARDMLTWQGSGGFSVDASVRIEGDDRAAIERLVRYCARGPLALERLYAPEGLASLTSPDARLIYRLPAPDPHGRTVISLTPMALLDRLASLIQPPRLHRHRYHGLLAPNARLRSTVIAFGRPPAQEPPSELPSPPVAHPVDPVGGAQLHPIPEPRRNATSRISWARLLARIYEVLPPPLPILSGGDARDFLPHRPSHSPRHPPPLGIPDRPPSLSPARAPPQVEIDFDQTPAFDPTTPDPTPDHDFDQSIPPEWES